MEQDGLSYGGARNVGLGRIEAGSRLGRSRHRRQRGRDRRVQDDWRLGARRGGGGGGEEDRGATGNGSAVIVKERLERLAGRSDEPGVRTAQDHAELFDGGEAGGAVGAGERRDEIGWQLP